MSQSETGTLATNESVMKQFRIASLITAVLILVQAALAGRGWFVDYDLIEVHGYVGNATFIVAIGLLGIAFNGYKRGALDRTDLIISVITLVLVVSQIGLGYGGRESTVAASLHWPNGVLITVLTAVLLGRTLPRKS